MPETARTRQERAEGLSGGAPKGCYGKNRVFLGMDENCFSEAANVKSTLIVTVFIINNSL